MEPNHHLVHKIGEYQYRTDRTIDILGHGSFGNVYKGSDHGNFVAIKIIQNARLEDHKTAQMMVNEINILRAINHPNVLSFITELRDKDNLYLITECCDYDLKAFIDDAKCPNEEDCAKILKDIVRGYDYLHTTYQIAHRDIKLENILIKMVDGKYVAKIADYGFARFIETKTTLTDVLMESYLGSQIYMAPEITTGHYNYTVDIYAIGIMYYFMLFHCYPNFIDSKFTIDLTNNLITKNSINFIENCVKEYAQRMHLDGVLAHPLIHDPFVDDDYHEMEKFEHSLN
jgi:serine/threonine protein kinase